MAGSVGFEAIDFGGGVDTVPSEDRFQNKLAIGDHPQFAGERDDGVGNIVDLIGTEEPAWRRMITQSPNPDLRP